MLNTYFMPLQFLFFFIFLLILCPFTLHDNKTSAFIKKFLFYCLTTFTISNSKSFHNPKFLLLRKLISTSFLKAFKALSHIYNFEARYLYSKHFFYCFIFFIFSIYFKELNNMFKLDVGRLIS